MGLVDVQKEMLSSSANSSRTSEQAAVNVLVRKKRTFDIAFLISKNGGRDSSPPPSEVPAEVISSSTSPLNQMVESGKSAKLKRKNVEEDDYEFSVENETNSTNTSDSIDVTISPSPPPIQLVNENELKSFTIEDSSFNLNNNKNTTLLMNKFHSNFENEGTPISNNNNNNNRKVKQINSKNNTNKLEESNGNKKTINLNHYHHQQHHPSQIADPFKIKENLHHFSPLMQSSAVSNAQAVLNRGGSYYSSPGRGGTLDFPNIATPLPFAALLPHLSGKFPMQFPGNSGPAGSFPTNFSNSTPGNVGGGGGGSKEKSENLNISFVKSHSQAVQQQQQRIADSALQSYTAAAGLFPYPNIMIPQELNNRIHHHHQQQQQNQQQPNTVNSRGGGGNQFSPPSNSSPPGISPSALLPPSLTALTHPAQNICAKCNIGFRMTSDLVYHMRSHHKRDPDMYKKRREEKLKCPVCLETFRERHHLTRHMTAHQDRAEEMEDRSLCKNLNLVKN